MRAPQPDPPRKLEAIPNIGKAIAADLRCIGILTPAQLTEREPLATYRALAAGMGQRHDPCVLYTLIAADHLPPPWRSCSLVEVYCRGTEAAQISLNGLRN